MFCVLVCFGGGLQVFGEVLVSPRLEILEDVIRNMWAQALLADFLLL